LKINYFKILFLSLFFLTALNIVHAQKEGDRIIAIVGNDIILESDLQYQMQMYARQNNVTSINPAIAQQIFQQMLTDKIILAKAEQDSVIVKDEEVNKELDFRLKSLIQQVGSEQRIQEVYGMPLVKIRLTLKEDLVKKMMSDKLKRKKFSNPVKVSDKEVRDFYNTYGDSLPPASEEFEMSHIFISRKLTDGEKQISKAKALQILDSVKAGTDFSELAKRNSDDKGSAVNGGDLGFAKKGVFVKEFEEALNKLSIGEVSDVVETEFGYHIIKVTDKKLYPTFEEDKENLKKIYKQSRYQGEYDSLIAHLKIKYNFKVNDNNLHYIASRSDSVKIGGDHPKMAEIKDTEVLSYTGNSVKALEFLNKLNGSNDYLNKLITFDLLKGAANKLGADYLLDEEALNLEKTNAEFASLMEDYRNGIFIFKLQDEEVWSKISFDSTKLYNYYTSTKGNYVFPDRINFSEIFSHKDSLINHYYSLLKKGADFDSVAAKYTERQGYAEKAGNYGLVEINNSPLSEEANKLKNSGDYSNPFADAGGFSIVKLVAKESSRVKTFEEAKAEVSGAFQESESRRLEQEYIDKLKNKYKAVIHYDNLEQAFKN